MTTPATKFRDQIGAQLKGYGIKRGTSQDIMSNLTPDARKWLMESTPEGTSIAFMVAAIVTDAYHEEVGE